ncbi:hypothetical protein [Lysinibacillus sp. G4S2]|nr:hypothetical protein [Lysinibacillus sp. G4S2]MDM5249253.1 hypothetical protein [Lysinibacillus sp. G4S2]
MKRLIGRPLESAQSERKSTTRFSEEPKLYKNSKIPLSIFKKK